MKEELSKYTCDNPECRNTITVGKEVYFGTPLHHRWIRMYRLKKHSDTAKTKFHFCCDQCAIAFLENVPIK